jgi:hypothetical protein
MYPGTMQQYGHQLMDLVKKRNNLLFFSALSVLALLRVGMVAGFLADIPHIEHSGWQFHCGGGDHSVYFSMAKSFAELRPLHEKYPIGFPLLLTPLIIMVNARVWQDLVKPVVLFHTMLAISSIYLVGCITRMLTRKIMVSIAAALVWTIAPYLLYYCAGFFNAQWLRNTYVSDLMWFSMLSEPSTSYLLLLGIYWYFLSLEKKYFAWMAGAVTGFAMCIRMPGVLYAAVFAGGYIAMRRFRSLSVFVLGILPVIIPQLCYNAIFNKGPLFFGYTAASENQAVLYSLAYTGKFAAYLADKHPSFFALIIAAGLTAPIFILYTLKPMRTCWAVLISIVYVHGLFYTTWWAFIHDFIRFTLPVIPVGIIMGAGCIAAAQEWSNSAVPRWSTITRES